MTPRIVLASASPRRKALLSALGLEFDVLVSKADEILEGVPEEIVVINARRKLDDVVATLYEPALAIAADTLVFLDEHVLGKPGDLVEARQMVSRLAGRTHQVITGVAVADTSADRCVTGFERTDVTFRPLSEEEVSHFVEIVRPFDRAGAYTVDGPGSLLVASYRGCYQNVLGLPIVRLDRLLRELGYSLFDLMDPARATFL